MEIKRHGLSIGIERIDNEFFFSLKAIGTLTHEDYETINPMVDNALAGIKNPKIKAFIDGSELDGWTIYAAWDDFKFGLKHGSQFEKIANLPSKEESLTVLAIMLNSPMQNFVNVLSSSMTKVVNVLEAVKNNKNI